MLVAVSLKWHVVVLLYVEGTRLDLVLGNRKSLAREALRLFITHLA